MSLRPPTYNGNPEESVIAFIADMEQYVAAQCLSAVDERVLLPTCLRGPARAKYDVEAVRGGAIGVIPNPPTAVSNTAVYTWLMAEYHNTDRQQQFKDKLLSTFQDENETPDKFYSRIREIVQNAGYPDMATQKLMTENTFMQGLFSKYSYAIRIAPTILNLNQKVEYANRIYMSERTSGNIQVPVPLHPSCVSVQPATIAPIPLPAPPVNQPVAPATDLVMDRLVEEFVKFTTHLIDRERWYEQRRPVQRFSSDYPRRNEYQGGYRIQQNNNVDRFLTCWNCGEEGHQARHCRTEKSRQAQSNNATRRHANLIQPQEIFDLEDEWEDYEAYIGKRGRDMKEEDGPQEESSRKRTPPRKQRLVTSRIRRRIPAPVEPRPVEVENTSSRK